MGPPGRRSVVTVYNPDGQSSAFTLPDGNVVFSFSPGPERFISLSPPAAEADSDVVVEISGVNTEFLSGDSVVGFGTSDVVAREIHVLNPGKIQAVVTVRGGAQPGLYKASVTTGLEILEAASGFRVTNPLALSDKPRVRYLSLVNSATLQPRLSPGALASLFGARLAVEGAADGVRVTLNGVPAALLSVSPTQINLQIPPVLTAGTVVVEVFNGVAAGDPMLVRLESVAPGLFALLHADGRLVDEASPATAGETVALLATGLRAEHVARPSKTVQVAVGPLRAEAAAVEAVTSFPGLYAIRFQVPAADASPPLVSVWVDGERSNTLPLPLASPVEKPAIGEPLAAQRGR